MTADRARGWRWRNVPVPEPHVAGLLAGALLHLVRTWPLPVDRQLALGVGGGLVVAGLAVVASTVRAVGREEIAGASTLVTGGPYRYSRNPMYVGWTVLYVGAASVAGTAWPLALLPLVAAATHLVVRREERALERRFGEPYRVYCREVRRYL